MYYSVWKPQNRTRKSLISIDSSFGVGERGTVEKGARGNGKKNRFCTFPSKMQQGLGRFSECVVLAWSTGNSF